MIKLSKFLARLRFSSPDQSAQLFPSHKCHSHSEQYAEPQLLLGTREGIVRPASPGRPGIMLSEGLLLPTMFLSYLSLNCAVIISSAWHVFRELNAWRFSLVSFARRIRFTDL